MVSRSALVVVTLLVLGFGWAASPVGAVPEHAATSGIAAAAGNDSAVPELNRTGRDTYRLSVGGTYAKLVVELNISLFTDFPSAGTLRFASFGIYEDTRIVGVEIALHYEGAPGIGAFLNDPLGYVELDVDFDLDLSFFGDALSIGSSRWMPVDGVSPPGDSIGAHGRRPTPVGDGR